MASLGLIKKLKDNRFLFKILVKRDFNRKYKRTVLGILWSMISPLLQLSVMALVFTQFFGRNTEHYIIYLFAGNIVFSYFKDATNSGMSSLVDNAGIFTKVNVPKYLFVLSKNMSALITFLLTLCIFFAFVIAEKGLSISIRYVCLMYPILCLIVFNIGISYILSALFVLFKDIKYLYDVFTQLLMYFSAIFYTVDRYPENIQKLFYLNPVYAYIKYFRITVLDGHIPSMALHLLCGGYALAAIILGAVIYHKNNYKFLYYV